MITRDQLEELDRQGLAAWDNHDPEAFVELFGSNPVVWHDDSMENPILSAKEAHDYMEGWFRAFPDMRSRTTLRVVDTEQGLVAAEVEFTGTNTGPLVMGGQEIPPTGRSVVGNGSYFVRVQESDDGVAMVEFHSHPNVLAMMAQLGLMPE
jgi:predicted ester cyclase